MEPRLTHEVFVRTPAALSVVVVVELRALVAAFKRRGDSLAGAALPVNYSFDCAIRPCRPSMDE